MNVLFVVAHPDDEILGAGGTIYKYIREGANVNVCILSGEVNARSNKPSDDELKRDMNEALATLGVSNVITGKFPNIQFNIVPHLEMVQFIEKVIIESKPDVVFTHHPADLNNDHVHTSLACQAAVKIYQRNPQIKMIREFYFMEVFSSTDWGTNTSLNQFNPNTFIAIGEDGLDAKLKAIQKYKNVIRPYPHARSIETIRALATYRGSQTGVGYCEAFQCVYKNVI